MSPEEVRTHNSAKRDLIVDLTLETRRRNLGDVFIDGVLLVNKAADLATEPDLIFCRWETLQSGRASLMERQPGSGRQVELHGSPDLVVEIVSRSSVKKDKKDLREAYFRADIPEYWIVDARKKLSFEILNWHTEGYRPAPMDAAGRRQSQVLQSLVSISRTAVQLGSWRYQLQFESP